MPPALSLKTKSRHVFGGMIFMFFTFIVIEYFLLTLVVQNAEGNLLTVLINLLLETL